MRVIWIDRSFLPGEAVKPLGHILNVAVKADHESPALDTELMLVDIHSYRMTAGEASKGKPVVHIKYYAVPTSDILRSDQAPQKPVEGPEVFVARFDFKHYRNSKPMSLWNVGKVFTKNGGTHRITRIDAIYFEPGTDPDNPILNIEFEADLLTLPSKQYVKHQRAAQRIPNFKLF